MIRMLIRKAEAEGAMTVGWGLTAGVIGLHPSYARQVLRRLAGAGIGVLPLLPVLRVPDISMILIGAERAGGVAAADALARRIAGPRRCARVILSHDCREQVFPSGGDDAPILLRAPLSAVAVRVLAEHVALRQRALRAA